MKNVLVTGASSGIGLMIANSLKKKGYHILGTSRIPKKYEGEFDFELLDLDITSQHSIDTCVGGLMDADTRIDVLINNAGMGVCGAIEETSDEIARQQLETNFWGTVAMTKKILPLMRKQGWGHIITVSSLAGLIGVPYQGFYAASKHALEGFFKSLRSEVKQFNISVSVIQPGFHKSGFHQSIKFGGIEIKDYMRTRQGVFDVFAKSFQNAPTPEKVAELACRIIESKAPKYSYRVGRDATMLPILQFLGYRFFELGVRKKFQLP